jgi:hypothetical protein
MLVKDLIKQLEEYKPDDELIVAYWDKETVEGYTEDLTLTLDQWSEVIFEYENGEFYWQSSAAEDFVDLANKVVDSSVDD